MQMSDETKKRLLETTETRLDNLTKEIDALGKSFQLLQSSLKIINQGKFKISLQVFENLLSFRLIIGVITLDLCSAMLIYLRGKFQYEAIYSSRQLIEIIYEAYKKLYGFNENKEGKKIESRNNSFWIKEIGNIVIQKHPEHKIEYDSISKKLEEFLNTNFDMLNDQRNLSIHYDKESFKVYKMLSKINVEENFKKGIPFLNILNSMFEFTLKLVQSIPNKIETAKQERNKKLDELLDNYENMDKNQLLQNIGKEIDDFTRMFEIK